MSQPTRSRGRGILGLTDYKPVRRPGQAQASARASPKDNGASSSTMSHATPRSNGLGTQSVVQTRPAATAAVSSSQQPRQAAAQPNHASPQQQVAGSRPNKKGEAIVSSIQDNFCSISCSTVSSYLLCFRRIAHAHSQNM